MHIVINDMSDGYRHIVGAVRDSGERAAPRGQQTREVMGALIELTNPRFALPVGIGRKFNPAIAAVEAAQLIGGVSHPEIMQRISSNMSNFMDGGTFHGAYGPRIRAQIPTVISRLTRDPSTRQALVTIWDPAMDAHVEGLHDYPCTISLQFFLRDGRLVMHTHMRSNDVFWGLAYDVFQFTQLQYSVANALGTEPGRYYHHVNSLHVYERDFDAIDQMHEYDGTTHPWLEGVGLPHERWSNITDIAQRLLTPDGNSKHLASGTEEWYRKQLWG